jgi:general stress protein 26
MDQKAIDLLIKERICVISVTLADGSPHAAVVHYSQTVEPVKLFIQTYPTVKVEAIKAKGDNAKAAVTVGLNEADFVELQMRGDVRIVSDKDELEEIYKMHYAKQPQAEQYKSESTIFLEFTPTWWRHTDFNTTPDTVIEG